MKTRYTAMVDFFNFAIGRIAMVGLLTLMGFASAQEGGVVVRGNSATPDPNYRLSPNDQLAISVYEEPELSLEVAVTSNGTITLPLIKQVKVSGKTVGQVEATIEAAYKDQEFLRFPQVSVTIAKFAERTVSVFGHVNKPGAVPFPGGQTRISLLSAIAGAGGFKQIANQRKVKITRGDGNGAERTMEVNVQDLLNAKDGADHVYLYPGDTVTVLQRII